MLSGPSELAPLASRFSLACERLHKMLNGAILVISVHNSTSAVQPPFGKSSIFNQLCPVCVEHVR